MTCYCEQGYTCSYCYAHMQHEYETGGYDIYSGLLGNQQDEEEESKEDETT